MPHPFIPELNQKYLDTSCLQKSIRRNLPEHALLAAERLFETYPQYLIKRLGTIVQEDIGLANLPLVASYLEHAVNIKTYDASTKSWLLQEVEKFCKSRKSRYLTEISFTTHFHPHYKAYTARMKDKDESSRLELLESNLNPLEKQCIAHTLRPKTLYACVPQNIARIMQDARALRTEGLHYALLPTHHMKPFPEVVHELPPVVLIGGLPSWTYDKHTRLGSMALRRFLKRHIPELHTLPFEEAFFALYLLLFEVETGRLHVEVPFPQQKLIKQAFWETCLPDKWTLEELLNLLPLLEERLPLLDEIRKEVV